MEALWGEDLPASAAKTLQNYVSGLRKSLPAGLVETTARGYRVRLSPHEVDAWQFEHEVGGARCALQAGDAGRARGLLIAALGLWRGEPLVDLADQPAGMAEAARLVELRRAARSCSSTPAWPGVSTEG